MFKTVSFYYSATQDLGVRYVIEFLDKEKRLLYYTKTLDSIMCLEPLIDFEEGLDTPGYLISTATEKIIKI